VGRLLRKVEASAYWLALAPLAAFLPARLAYRVACWRGDWTSRSWPEKHSEFTANLRELLGEELSPEEADRVARDIFRFMSCEAIDVMRLRGRARSLRKLVEIRGREHLEAALAGGKGAILCSPHFSSHPSAFSVLHASGFPFTTIGRWGWRYDTGVSSAERRFWELVYARRLQRHQQRSRIEPWPGRVQVAVQAATALRANEVVSISSDTPPLYDDRPRAVEVPFLGRQAMLLPGVVTLARLTGAPVLMAFAHHSADYYHQVLEISAPVPMDGDTNKAFRRCVAAMDAAIRSNPAEWTQWDTDDLSRLGLLGTAPGAGTSAVSPRPAAGDPAALLEDRRLAWDHRLSRRCRSPGQHPEPGPPVNAAPQSARLTTRLGPGAPEGTPGHA
jgi:lauroyl/myristoyl acyltransferase